MPRKCADEMPKAILEGQYAQYMENPLSLQERAQRIGQIMTQLRVFSGYSQKQLCKVLGATPQSYSGYEAGRHIAPVETLIRIAYIFEVSLDYLVGMDSLPCINAADQEDRLTDEERWKSEIEEAEKPDLAEKYILLNAKINRMAHEQQVKLIELQRELSNLQPSNKSSNMGKTQNDS